MGLFQPLMRGLFAPLLGPLSGGGGGAFSPLTLFTGGIVGAWYDPSDLTTLFQDSAGTVPVTADGDPVGMMRDKSGNGNHLAQATTASKPAYKTSGGRHWIEGDGVDDWLRAAFTITQPWERISAIRQISWTALDRIFGMVSGDGRLIQRTATPTIGIFDGTGAIDAGTLPLSTNGVVTERHANTTSRLAINDGAYVTGTTGTSVPGGVELFGNSNPANARCYGFIMRAGTMSDATITSTRAYLAAKAGVTL
ncbi:MAG: hypothetical protein EOS04_24265 [Mesorhizobium sp.]|nr:MAG: hypothetical protein EOR98_26605 [Mesorhizobium sp.]RWN73186.1 MAG: hypothetical protein EOS01_26950 [Mesorhizobium sp.]RWN85160.1 MAG: hypothetical protein EOS04_24265 [Mesorhizobium sp.]